MSEYPIKRPLECQVECTAHLKPAPEQVSLMIGSNSNVLAKMKAGEFNDIVWASDNLETVAHYYEGCIINLIVSLDHSLMQEYVATRRELKVTPAEYTWGCVSMHCPTGALWYSFSKSYLQSHLVEVKEIYPNLSEYFEND